MNELKITLRQQPAACEPGAQISGNASWRLDHAPKSVEVRLFYRTSGRGMQDVGVAQTVAFEAPMQEDSRSFTLTAPDAPYSFSGKLITLTWAAELVTLPSKDSASVDLVIAPGGTAVQL